MSALHGSPLSKLRCCAPQTVPGRSGVHGYVSSGVATLGSAPIGKMQPDTSGGAQGFEMAKSLDMGVRA
ncbi:MAG: hypothetical protein AAF581_00290 [Planctomycetota bacterium]